MSKKNSNDTIGNRTRDLPACSVVSQPTASARAPFCDAGTKIFKCCSDELHMATVFVFGFSQSFGVKNQQEMFTCRSQWPRGLRRRSTAVRLLRSWVRILPGAWMSVCFECCVLSGRGLCDGLITRPEESYRLWRVVVCDHKTS